MVCKHFLFLILLIVHISSNLALDGLKFWMHVANIHVEGTVSQIFYLGFVLCQKIGNFFLS